ncbi:Trichohyalin [Fusarium oxysporum f. sp. albedinis]|nr:Trichohyalin [Fusarium oxysporum f. sp. albedinis]
MPSNSPGVRAHEIELIKRREFNIPSAVQIDHPDTLSEVRADRWLGDLPSNITYCTRSVVAELIKLRQY